MPEGPSMATDILAGNIGLLTINDLMGEISELDASMAKLVNTDSLIIDVRECPGGSGEISTQLSSFFMSEGEELMSLYTRGVPVDVNASAPIAVDRAQQLILSELLAIDETSSTLAKALKNSNEKTNKVLLEQVQNRRKYHALLGDYGDDRALTFEQGQLKYKTPRGMKIPLKQLDSDLFMMMSKRASIKVRVERNAEGEVTGISVSPRPGQTEWKACQRG
jgi:hypothetical protein